MIAVKIPWNIKAVLTIHVLRLVFGLLLVRILYPIFFTPTSFIVELTDRLLVIGMVGYTIRSVGGNFPAFGLSFNHLLRNVILGMGTGLMLLGVSLYTERLLTTVLLLTPVQHPLVVQVEQAMNVKELVFPLLLAGIAAPVSEEMLYRLFTFLPLKERFGLWGGTLLSASVFALMHFNPYWLAEMIIVGSGLALLYYWSGSLVSAITAHSVINTTKVLLIYFNIPLS